MKKYAVVYLLPSGMWMAFSTDDKTEADSVAASEEQRTGWPHKVYKQ